MNKQEIIRMAREAGFNVEQGYLLRITGIDEDLERFAALVASAEREVSVNALRTLNDTYEIELHKAIADEREKCAKACEETTASWTQHLYNEGCIDCAKAIRAKGQA